ncbi:MAG: phytoene desaturase family protein, partial [Candidatus Competibacterales bacterium]
MTTPGTAIVIGGGFGGLASALRLRALGYAVRLLDRAPRLGGRAQVFERDGFTHDAGPTVLTAPFLFEELFALFNKSLADYVELVPVTPWYRFRFPDGRQFDYGGTLEQTLDEIRRIHPPDVDGYRRLVETSRRIFAVGFTELAHRPFHSLPFMLRQVPALVRLQSYRTVYGLVSRHIQHDYLRRAFSLQPLLVWGNPFDTTSIYALIHYLERQWGVHFPKGGTGALVDALGKLMDEEGIEVGLSTTVDQILVEGGKGRRPRATGVRLADGSHLRADVVVVNGDPPHVYRHMIPKERRRRWSDRRIDRLKYSMGLFVLYFATNRSYGDVAHHTIWLGERYRELLRDIFQRKVLADDFSLYLHRPGASDPTMAPPGCDGFYVLSPVPNLQGNVDWAAVGDSYRDRILEALESTLLPDLRRHLVHQFYMTPLDFQSRYLSYVGSGFSLAPRFTQSAYYLFHNKAEDIDGLYFVGAATHPRTDKPAEESTTK